MPSPITIKYGAIYSIGEINKDWLSVKTQPCPFCGRTAEFALERIRFEAWQTDTKIQDAFPELSADEREVLISGTCASCWERQFGSGEEGW